MFNQLRKRSPHPDAHDDQLLFSSHLTPLDRSSSFDDSRLSPIPMERNSTSVSSIEAVARAVSSSIQLSPSVLKVTNPDNLQSVEHNEDMDNPWKAARERDRAEDLDGLGLYPPVDTPVNHRELFDALERYHQPSPGGEVMFTPGRHPATLSRGDQASPHTASPPEGVADAVSTDRPTIRLVRSSTASTHQTSFTLNTVQPLTKAKPFGSPVQEEMPSPQEQDVIAYHAARTRLTHRSSPLLPEGFRSPRHISYGSPYIEPMLDLGQKAKQETFSRRIVDQLDGKEAQQSSTQRELPPLPASGGPSPAQEAHPQSLPSAQQNTRQAGINDWYKHVVGMVRGQSGATQISTSSSSDAAHPARSRPLERIHSANTASTDLTLAPQTVPFRIQPFSRLFGSSEPPIVATEIDPSTGRPISSNVPYLKYVEAIQRHPDGKKAVERLTGKFPGLSVGNREKDRSVDSWPRAKWLLLVSVIVLLTYGILAFAWAMVFWGRHSEFADVTVVSDPDLVVYLFLFGIAVLASATFGFTGLLLNSRQILTFYNLLLWFCFVLLAVIGYSSYRRRNGELNLKLNERWNNELHENDRLRLQEALHCCGYFNPLHQAVYFRSCYPRSSLPGCKSKWLRLEKATLHKFSLFAFSLVPAHLLSMVAALLCSNHVTRLFGKGITPKQYRLSMADVRANALIALSGMKHDKHDD